MPPSILSAYFSMFFFKYSNFEIDKTLATIYDRPISTPTTTTYFEKKKI